MSHKSKSPSPAGVLSAGKVGLIRLAAGLAAVISIYLTWVALGGGAVAGCGPDSGCDRVLQSRWSKWLGMPVSLFGVAVYGGVLVLSTRLGRRVAAERQRQAWCWLVPGAVLILGSVAWFVALQLLVIQHVCPFCMAVHAAGLLVGGLLLFSAPFRPVPEKPWQAEKEVYVAPATGRKLALGALGGVALLALGQVAIAPRMYSLLGVAGGEVEARTFKVYGGAFEFDLNTVPLIGSPGASNAIVSLFDYTCHHCREMHHVLLQASRTFSNELAIVSLPMPLDNQCNPHVRVTPKAHSNACEYARLGLAVWRADRRSHAKLEDWLFAPATPPPVAQARDFAAGLLGGTNILQRALADPWISRQLKQGIDLYGTNFIHHKNGAMPQLIIGTNLAGGSIGQLADLYRLLESQLGLRPRPGAIGPGATPPARNAAR